MRNVTILLAALLIGSTLPNGAMQGTPAAGDIKTEEGLRAALDGFEARYETACRAMGEAAWSDAMGEPAAPGSGSRRAGAVRDLAALYADPKLVELLAYWVRRRTVTSDPTLMRRVQMWYHARDAAAVTLDPAISELESDLASRMERHRFTLDGRPVGRDELRRILATEPDPVARRRAWTALASVAVEMQADVKRLVRMRADKAQLGKYRYFHDLLYRVEDLEPYWVFHMMEIVTSRTNGAWEQLLGSLRTTVGQTQLQPWDIDFAMNRRAEGMGLSRIAGAALKPDGAIPAARRLMEALGFDLSRVALRTEVRPVAAPSLWVPVAIPTDLRVIVSPQYGPIGAAAFYEAVLRAHGRALQAVFNARSAPMLKGYPWIPGTLNGVYAEGMAGALGDFARDPLFASRILGLSSADAEIFLTLEKDRRLLQCRRLLLAMGIEFTIYANPDADLDGRYHDLAARALGVDLSGPDSALWTADPMLVSRPVHYQDEMLALSVAAELHQKIRSLFEAGRLGSGKVAPWLIERCYARGEMGTLHERLGDSIQGGFGFDAFLTSLGGQPLSVPK
ncbi:MAG TPA: hypothetical protein VGK94_12345 [Candidatus Polarisedimenticolia bacterium]|jgi:hypothetical protein